MAEAVLSPAVGALFVKERQGLHSVVFGSDTPQKPPRLNTISPTMCCQRQQQPPHVATAKSLLRSAGVT